MIARAMPRFCKRTRCRCRQKAFAASGNADLTRRKNERLVWWHEPLMVMKALVPRELYVFAGMRLIWVSLRSDATLRPWAQARPSAQLPASAQPDAAAERPGVVGLQLSARFLCAQERPH